jgi:formate dehydrogenase iron-sulfur subunit
VNASSPSQQAVIEECIAIHEHQPGALLPLLHAIQDRLGYVPPEAVAPVAQRLNLSRAEVHGVITYYHHFHEHPPHAHKVSVCQAEACQSRGCRSTVARAEQLVNSSAAMSDAWEIEPVYCLGLCADGPSAEIDGQLYAGVTPERLESLMAHAAQQNVRPADAGEIHRVLDHQGGIKVFVSLDSAALAKGADQVAREIRQAAAQRNLNVQVVRNGSRGMLWLEPLVEVEVNGRRVAYGPVSAEQVSGLLDAGMLEGKAHALCHGVTDEIQWLKSQERLTFARVGITDPLSLADYEAHGGLLGLKKALGLKPEAIVEEVMTSGLRGRGGAGFPAAIKWRTVAQAKAPQKYIVVNADEGDSGTFADRMLMEGDPYLLMEGMAIAGIATGATCGYVYIRSEYPQAFRIMEEAVKRATQAGWLGSSVLGSAHAFTIEIRKAAGSYVCGEETALLESVEGRRGIVRAKPPLPALQGLFGQPTVINNVLTLAAVPYILDQGGAAYANYGMGRSKGTLPFQLAGNLKHGGLVEKAFGLSIRQLVEDFGGGTQSGKPLRAVQIGGPLGAYVPASQLDLPMDYEALAAKGAVLGHGGLVVFDTDVDMLEQARYAMEFCAAESCGKCTPCRIGSTRGVEVIEKLRDHPEQKESQAQLLRDLCDTMLNGSLCAMGGMTPYPVLSALDHFPEDFGLPKVGQTQEVA